MPSKFETASDKVQELVLGIKEAHHADLHTQGVTIDVLFAYAPENSAGEKTGPALKSGGYQCAGMIKIVPLVQRVSGCGDARMLLDGDKWDDLHPDQQAALIDHELQHLSVAKDVEGAIILDSHGRPKLKMRLHDYQFGWFTSVARRHKEASMEVIQAAQLYSQAWQAYFPFLEQALPAPADPDALDEAQKPAPKKKGKKSK